MDLKCKSWSDLQEINLFNDFNFKKAPLVKFALHDKEMKVVQMHIVILRKDNVLGEKRGFYSLHLI
jgi:hypothetical protein